MNFDDRLRRQMSDQSADLIVTAPGAEAVAERSRARKQRRAAGVVVAATLMIAGVGGWVVGRNSTDRVEVAAPDAIEQVGIEAGDSAAAASGSPEPSLSQGSAPEDAEVVAPGLGPSLVFTDVSSEASPGGYNIYQNGRANGLYYVLSTAPGVGYDDLGEGEWDFRPDTLYTFDGSGWQSSDFGDRFISTINSDDTGALYTVSTGTATSQELAVGASTDAGQNWTWTPIDLTEQLGPDSNAWPFYRVVSDSDGDQHFVVVEVPAGPQWEEAIALAIEGGADINPETDEIYGVDELGIEWLPDSFEYHETPIGPCSRASDDHYSDLLPEEAFDPPYPYQDFETLTEQQRDELAAWETEQTAIWRGIQADATEFLRTVDGCESYADCQDLISVKQQEIDELSRSSSEPLPDVDSEDEALWSEYDEWFATSGCEDVLSEGIDYDLYYEDQVENTQAVTWAELGVVIPDHWMGSRHGYLVDRDTVTKLGPLFADQTGFMLEVEIDGSGYEAIFDSSTYEGLESEADYSPSFDIWTSSDAVTWTSATVNDFRYSPETAAIGGATFDVAWDEQGDEPNDLRRSNADGSVDLLKLADLAPDLDQTSNMSLWGVAAGEYGIVAWGGSWDDDNDIGYNVNSIVLYSADGISWGATSLDGLSINDIEVGTDDVMIFTSDPRLANSGKPQPLLVGEI